MASKVHSLDLQQALDDEESDGFRAGITFSPKQTTKEGAEIMTLTHSDGRSGSGGGVTFTSVAAGLVASSSYSTAAAPTISFDDVRFDFIHAAQTGDCEQLQLIIEMKIDVNVQDDDGYTALTLASCYGHERVVAALLAEPRINVNMMAYDGCTALQVAAQDGFDGVTKLLVAAKAELDLAARGAAGPLFLAAQEGTLDCPA
jgi:hypothetical protein